MTRLRLILELGAQVAALLARNATFAVALASKPVACHSAVLQLLNATECLLQSPCHICNIRDIV